MPTFNPAVTLALMTFCGFDKRKVVPSSSPQIPGAFASAALVYALYSNLFTQWELTHNVVRGSVESLGTAGIFSTYPNALLSNMQAFAVEMVITAVLMLGIMALGDGAPTTAPRRLRRRPAHRPADRGDRQRPGPLDRLCHEPGP